VPAERQLADLENSLAQVKLDPAENASLLAPLLDIPLPKERAPVLAPEELRRRQLSALTNWVTAGAKVQPVVLAFEDLHWADPTTLDVLHGIAERGALAPLFIVATTRPEFRPPWGMRSHHGTISLAPLDRAQVRDIVAELSARHALPRDVVEDVAARTGGVPLFVEEVTRLLLERGEQGGGIQAIPPTLQQSLIARLDRLGPAREVAQIGSVIGRGFSYGLLRDVAGMEEAGSAGKARRRRHCAGPGIAAGKRTTTLGASRPRDAGRCVSTQRPFLAATSILSPSRKTRFSSQPLDLAGNFPSLPSSR
jgi:predicted ATPase